MIAIKRKTYHLLLVLAAALFLFSGWQVFAYFREGHETQRQYKALAEQAEAARQEASGSTESNGILPEYQAHYSYNPHLVGWVTIADTVIDYPVMQTPEDPEYYLHRDFGGAENVRGCIFADGACNVETSDNVTIYGHHMNDGSMFASLLSYDDKSYWQAHPVIQFDSLTERRSYQIFAVFRTTASVGQGFAYHQFADAATEAEFNEFVAQCKELSLYDTGITPAFGQRLVCLSTCEYSRENGRFVVAAVEIQS